MLRVIIGNAGKAPTLWPSSVLEWTQLVSNVGTAFAAVMAFIALRVISTKTLESQWNDSFRRIYDEFWQDENIAQARKMITYDQEYNKIRKTLIDMASSTQIIGDMTEHVRSGGQINSPDIKSESKTLKEGLSRDKAEREFTDFEVSATENIDLFCSKCLQLVFTSDVRFFRKRQREFKRLFFHFWIDAIDHREELSAYIERFWPSLTKQINEQRLILPRQRI